MNSTTTENDRTCAALAKAALFPKRMHRDVASASHFPALLQLDLLRDLVLQQTPNASVSSVFPRHVVVVRNLADGGIQWNGEPDFDTSASHSFSVIPEQLSVRCTSNCHTLLSNKKQRAFLSTNNNSKETEIVLCSDRILQADAKDKRYQGIAKELPPKSLQAVTEVLAHQLVVVRHQTNNTNKGGDSSHMQVEAARAAECYFSRHAFEDKTQIQKGSRLQWGYSKLPGFLQTWSMNKCLSAVAKENLLQQSPKMSKQDVDQAVQAALKAQQ